MESGSVLGSEVKFEAVTGARVSVSVRVRGYVFPQAVPQCINTGVYFDKDAGPQCINTQRM